ncbi:MAG: hypothetical protein LQ350_001069 [Teloschistes chrysophthalmus]|nr:MAG: hypothetical protein LQ350_001069 [Niorma chrysophthalma]
MALSMGLLPRQIWAMPTPTATSLPRHCTPVRLPSGGLLAIGDGNMITLTQEAIFQPLCTSIPGSNATLPDFDAATFDDKDPFYASTLPQMYAIAAVTVVSYLLVIIIFITPRTFFVGGSGGGAGFLGSRGMISGASGSTSVIGVGGRPWLQKVAALTVAISLTIASVDVFREAERQYDGDFSDAIALTNEVVNSLELRIVRVISETVLWLAQAQTLIRLFPRHKEKVIIKWAGFVLIALDTIFSILNSFVSGSAKNAPRRYQDAVPALNYLFTFSLSLIYAAWIIYYSLSKRRYAFLHAKMRNICLVALLSYVAILIPVVFFILDISIYNVAGWGNYVRWVGAAAASVVVWEWVERIEALERDERKDGILGREIFDGDEMLNLTPSSAVTWANSRRFGGGSGGGQKTTSTGHKGLSSFARRLRGKRRMPRQDPDRTSHSPSLQRVDEYMMSGVGRQISDESSQPGQLLTTASTTKTVGASGLERSISQGNYHSVIVPPPAHTQSDSSSSQTSGKSDIPEPQGQKPTLTSSVAKTMRDIALKIPIPFLNRHMSPPIEVKKAVRPGDEECEADDEESLACDRGACAPEASNELGGGEVVGGESCTVIAAVVAECSGSCSSAVERIDARGAESAVFSRTVSAATSVRRHDGHTASRVSGPVSATTPHVESDDGHIANGLSSPASSTAATHVESHNSTAANKFPEPIPSAAAENVE